MANGMMNEGVPWNTYSGRIEDGHIPAFFHVCVWNICTFGLVPISRRQGFSELHLTVDISQGIVFLHPVASPKAVDNCAE